LKFTTRPATPEDDAFLYELFKCVRAPKFAHASLGPEQLELLLNIQYNGQKTTYGAQYPGGDEIVMVGDEPIGRVWLHRAPSEHHLVDIALMPAHRNQGIGGALISEAVAGARSAGVPLRCSIAVTNQGSLRFHQRLGFQIVAQDDMYYELAV
jgi:ribosomal protein S18 acetylase RimI-like enzyme